MSSLAAPQTLGSLARRPHHAELIDRCVAGEAGAARLLHAHYFPVASAFLRKLGTKGEELEDACQEVFLQFFRYLATFRGDAEIKTWLYRLCVTEARRVRRKRRLGAALAAILRREQPEEAVPAAVRSDASMLRMVQVALDRMSEKNRLVFVLFEMEGLSGKAVAEIAGCPEATVWRRLHDARRVFREASGLGPSPDDADGASGASGARGASGPKRAEGGSP